MRVDRTGFGEIKVIQNEGLGYGVDSILLAAFAAGETGAKGMRAGSKVLDLGSGSGIVGFVICHKVKGTTVTGIEKRESAYERSKQATELNNMQDRINFVHAEVKDYTSSEKYDVVVSNPPYFKQASAIPNEDSDKFIARHETTANLFDFINTASRMLEDGGNIYLVHRPDRLVDIFHEMRANGIEPKEIQLIAPHPGEGANIVLVHGIKGAKSELKILPEIVVHNQNGDYTDVIEQIYERRKLW